MGAVIYSTTIYSDYGTQYKINIYDKEGTSDTNTDFNMFGSGFELSYKGIDKGTYSPIIASEVKLFFAIENSDDQTFINNIVSAQERKYFIHIYKGASNSFYWGGVILTDLITELDESLPSKITLTAIDGLGLLKEFTYGNPNPSVQDAFSSSVYNYLGYETLLKHLGRVFQGFLEILQFDIHTDLSQIFTSGLTFYETQTYSSSPANSLDPLSITQVNHTAFIKLAADIDEFDEGVTYYEVLRQICLIFNARFFLSDGKWRLYNINQYQDSSFYERTYNFTSDWGTAENFSIAATSSLSPLITLDQDSFASLAIPSRSYFSPFLNIERTFSKENSENLLSQQEEYCTKYVIQDVNTNIEGSGTSYKLRLTGNGAISVNNDDGTYQQGVGYRWKGKLKISDGTSANNRWFWNDSGLGQFGFNTWKTVNSDFYVSTPQFDLTGEEQVIDFTFEITTNFISYNITELQFSLCPYMFWLNGQGFVPNNYAGLCDGTAYAHNQELLHTSLSILKDGVVQPDPITTNFSAYNPTTYTNSISEDLPDSLIGDDDEGGQTFGKFKVYNTSANWVDSTSWKIGGTGTADKIINLELQEILKLHEEPLPKLNGQIKGDIEFFNSISYDSKKWLPSGITLNSKTGTWAGQWFEINEKSEVPLLASKDNAKIPLFTTNTNNILKSAENLLFNLKNKAYNLTATTSNNTKTEIFLNNIDEGRINLPINSVANFKAYVASVLTSGSDKGDVIAIEQFGAIKNINDTLALIGTTTSSQKADSGIGGSVAISIEPDNTNKSIKVSVTGDSSESMEWKVNLDLTLTGFQDSFSLIYEDDNNIITEASDNLVTQLNL